MFRWDPDQYVRFGGERGRPFADMVSRIGAIKPTRVLDLGCGDGAFTASLAQRWPTATIEGIDASAEMIAHARAAWTGPSVTFTPADVGTLVPTADYDVVISNAMFQWLPNHATVMQRWAQTLVPGAWFAFQVPGNFTSPSHQLMRALAESAEWAPLLPADLLRHHDTVGSPDEYATVFLDAGWTVDAWETTYAHLLPGVDPVLEWVRGTGLRPVLEALSAEDAARFSAEYGAQLRRAYPGGPHGTFFDFRRIFCVAHCPDDAAGNA